MQQFEKKETVEWLIIHTVLSPFVKGHVFPYHSRLFLVRRSPDVAARFRHQSHWAGPESPCCALGVAPRRCSVTLRRRTIQVSPRFKLCSLCAARRRSAWAGRNVLCVPVYTLPQMSDSLGVGLNVKRPSQPLDAIDTELKCVPEVWAPRWPIAMRPSNYAFERTVTHQVPSSGVRQSAAHAGRYSSLTAICSYRLSLHAHAVCRPSGCS